ncbi:MAG: hypothetical protein LHW45_09330 [Candidatus Cloacimonetes bacterium]|jgi:hypothetical protein|nr:hypothetical protein [Candidatus Cloacimonadota bacterium]MDD3143718.1 hypothetical protein [Candidatus Cloacimonadota bacterium]MDY0367812.1 hypothetical protein [Candidatus Syntrophosphaera sp.]HOY83929.1 hypothetical protein [Candidatus Syntrophosphaera sp.]HPH60429.1 hypothetical protein [Candidatus Syntrophosphaera sp.]
MRAFPKTLFLVLALLIALPLAALPKIAYLGMSAALPGSGEIALGKSTRGGIMLTTDLLALTAWLATGREIDNLTGSYRKYAEVYAGIPENMSDSYYQVIQQYISSDEFNQLQTLEARNFYLIYNYDPAGYEAYLAENTYSAEDAWAWQSSEHQDQYRSLRFRTQTVKMYRSLSLGVMLLNRVISLIDVALISRNPDQPTALYFTPLESGGLMLNYRLEF